MVRNNVRPDTLIDWGSVAELADTPPPPTAEDPRARLAALLTAWARMDESAWTQEAVDRLKDQILDVFAAHPGEADGWYRAWRAMHPEVQAS